MFQILILKFLNNNQFNSQIWFVAPDKQSCSVGEDNCWLVHIAYNDSLLWSSMFLDLK